jgi:hypothetical protein
MDRVPRQPIEDARRDEDGHDRIAEERTPPSPGNALGRPGTI